MIAEVLKENRGLKPADTPDWPHVVEAVLPLCVSLRASGFSHEDMLNKIIWTCEVVEYEVTFVALAGKAPRATAVGLVEDVFVGVFDRRYPYVES